MAAYFDLAERRSYKGTPNETTYIFHKGVPVAVSDLRDMAFFRNQPETFVEVDESGNALKEKNQSPSARSFKTFRDNTIFGKPHEDVLQDAYQDALNRRSLGTPDPEKLKMVAAEDAIESFTKLERKDEVKSSVDVSTTTATATKTAPAKVKTVKSADGKFKCDRCGQKFDNEQKFQVHLEDHEDED